MTLTIPERWRITLFFQLPSICQWCLHYFEKMKHYTLRNRKQLFFCFPVRFGLKNCYAMLLSSIIYVSTSKSNLVVNTLCVSLCSTGFCSIRRLPIKFLLDRLIIKNPFFQTSVKKAVLQYIVQCVFLKITFCFQVCYLTDFVDTKHTLYNFLKRTKLISSFFSKKCHFIKVNSFKLFLL